MERTDIAVIGAGVVGLAVAARLAGRGRTVVVLERNDGFGRETSSRNSEVIHSGIYYPSRSLKARLCVRGNALLYRYCREHGIRHAQTGKIVVASSEDEVKELKALLLNGTLNGVEGLTLLDGRQVRALEPDVNVEAGLLVPATGILDTHGFMERLAAEARARGALLVTAAEVTGIAKTLEGFVLTLGGDGERLAARRLVNCAGLGADAVALMAGIDIAAAGYRLFPCKGEYFRLNRRVNVKRLIYPVPSKDVHHLGIHITQSLDGSIRLGPNAYYVDSLDYTVGDAQRETFYRSTRRYLPAIESDDLSPDTAGIRPKLQGPGEGFRDFVIRKEASRGLPGLVNLIGIESPGLTASLAIAEHVEELLRRPG